jgi:hypothetical protein
MTNLFKKSITISAIILLFFLIYIALNIALADIKHYPVKHWIQKVENGQPIVKADIDKAIITIKAAIELTSNNVEYHEYLARLHFLNAIVVYNNDNSNVVGFREHLIKAYFEHKIEIKHRQQWPHSWSNLALIKAYLLQYGAEFDLAINNAEKYGPWEIVNNEVIVQAGFVGWNSIANDTKVKVVRALERVHAQKRLRAEKLLKDYALESSVCSILENRDRFKGCKI